MMWQVERESSGHCFKIPSLNDQGVDPSHQAYAYGEIPYLPTRATVLIHSI